MSREDYDAKQFGERLKKIRRANRMTQEELSEKLFLSVDSISRIENGKTHCMPEHVVRLSNVFDVPVDYFYFGERTTKHVDEVMKNILHLLKIQSAADKKRAYEILKLFFCR